MRKQDLPFRTPYLNAAGMLGFAPNPRAGVDLSWMGAFFTHPVSLAPRKPAVRRAALPFAGGVLLHTGLPNPGLTAVLKRYAARWADAAMPVVVHLLAETASEANTLVRRLEGLENVAGVELGFAPQATPAMVSELLRAAAGELPVIASLDPQQASLLSREVGAAGAAAISLAAPRGSLPGADGALVAGRLYGPAIFPLALDAVRALASQPLPVIASGGARTRAEADRLLHAGAVAVQLDVILWKRWGAEIGLKEGL